MSDLANESATDDERRCAHCDSVIPAGSNRCLMCGSEVPQELPPSQTEATVAARDDEFGSGAEERLHRGDEGQEDDEAEPDEQVSPSADEGIFPSEVVPPSESATSGVDEGDAVVTPPAVDQGAEIVEAGLDDAVGEEGEPFVESVMKERRSRAVFWMTAVVAVLTAIVGYLVLQYGGPVQVALVPTASPIPPTPSFTPTVTLPPTETAPPSLTPTITPPPTATGTPQPPRVHNVQSGETLFGLSLFYNVSMESIAGLNGFSIENPIQSGQTLEIPYPTATPELEPIVLEINGEPVVADPRGCERYEIQVGDAISVIAGRYNINFELLQRVNRLTDQTILQPGDTICIPEIRYGEVLPPTPGPSPTPSPTSFPPGPALLYPADGIEVTMEEEPIALQWVAVKDLAADEWYMVEVTDVSVEGAHPLRGFTRENSFRLPESWRPDEESFHDFRWRVSIVRVTGRREDGGFIYTFGGRNSEDATFTWLGAVPTPTPTPTATPTSIPEA